MRALITGGTGFVGSHLIETLVARGVEVTALVRSPAKAARLVELDVRIVDGDLDDATALRLAAEGQDVIYHVAGVVAAGSRADYERVNRGGTAKVVEAAAATGEPRMILVSSLAAAGPSVPKSPLQGGEPESPVTNYGRSKLAAERVVRECGLPWCILRPPMVYGPRDVELLRVFKAAKRGIVPVFGRGDQRLSAVYASDLAEALMAVATEDRSTERVYYPCHGTTFSTRELALEIGRSVGRSVRVIAVAEHFARGFLAVSETIARITGRTTVLNRDKANEFFQPAWTASPAELERDTGWVAAHDLRAGLQATAEWYGQHGWL